MILASANFSSSRASRSDEPGMAKVGTGLRHAVFLKPGEHHRPRVLCRVGVVAWPVIGEKAVLRVGIDLALAGLAGVGARLLALVDQLLRDALVLSAVEGEHRAPHVLRDVFRVLRRQLADLAR